MEYRSRGRTMRYCGSGGGRCGCSGLLGSLGGKNSSFVICRSFAVFKVDGIDRTCRETVSKTITVMLADKLCLAVYYINSTLMTCCGAQTTADAFFFINFNNLSNHTNPLF